MRIRHVEGFQTPWIRVSKLLDSDSKKKKKRKIEISTITVRKLSDLDSEEEDVERTISRVRVGKLLGLGFEEDEKIAISRVRVLRNMPSVGMRRSTRVFVPKSMTKTASDADLTPASVLRSGKRRLTESFGGEKATDGDLNGDDEWMRSWEQKRGRMDGLDGCDDASDGCIALDAGDRGESAVAAVEELVVAADAGDGPIDNRFGIVYNRRRQRKSPAKSSSGAGVSEDRRYGIQYVRKQQMKKESSTGLDLRRRCSSGSLFISVESSLSSLRQFSCFLVSVLGWMMRRRGSLSEFTYFLLSHPMAHVFGLHGIHFETEPNWSLETVSFSLWN